MNHHVEYYAKKKRENFDKSTVYDGSTENPIEHPNFPKPKYDLTIQLGIWSVCIWLAIALASAKFNISKGDLKPHTWLVLDFFTAFLIMFWSAIVGAYVWDADFKDRIIIKGWITIKGWFIKWALWWSCIVLFVSSILYMIMFVINLLNK